MLPSMRMSCAFSVTRQKCGHRKLIESRRFEQSSAAFLRTERDPSMMAFRKTSALLVLVAITCVIAGAANAGQNQFLVIDGSVEGEWNSAYFPNQSFDVPLDGNLLVSAIDSKRVRITGNYHYAAEVQSICFLGFCPPNFLIPYPFEIDATVDVIATIGSQNGRTVYRAPRGEIVEQVWLGAFNVSFTRSFRMTLPDLVLSSGRWGFGGEWFSDGPLVFDVEGGQIELFLGGPL